MGAQERVMLKQPGDKRGAAARPHLHDVRVRHAQPVIKHFAHHAAAHASAPFQELRTSKLSEGAACARSMPPYHKP